MSRTRDVYQGCSNSTFSLRLGLTPLLLSIKLCNAPISCRIATHAGAPLSATQIFSMPILGKHAAQLF